MAQLVFPGGGKTPPSVDEVVNICKTLQKELHVTSLDQRLSLLVAKNVAKTAKLYFVKTESMLSNDDVAIQVGGDVTSAQLRNISLANRLDQFFKGLRSIINSQLGAALSEEAVTAIESTTNEGETLLEMILVRFLLGCWRDPFPSSPSRSLSRPLTYSFAPSPIPRRCFAVPSAHVLGCFSALNQ